MKQNPMSAPLQSQLERPRSQTGVEESSGSYLQVLIVEEQSRRTMVGAPTGMELHRVPTVQ